MRARAGSGEKHGLIIMHQMEVLLQKSTRMGNPGYPLDITVSPKGDIIMVSYIYTVGVQ